MKSQKNKIFKWSYSAFLGVMIVLVIASAIGMRGLLKEYEFSQPEYRVMEAIEQLSSDAASADGFWSKYSLPEIEISEFEKNDDIKSKYISLFDKDKLEYAVSKDSYGEDEMRYIITNGKIDIAEVTLKADGPVKNKLIVFSLRDWRIENIKPIFGKNEYTVQLPDYFTLFANGITIPAKNGVETDSGKLKYSISGVYFEPKFEIVDTSGNKVSYIVKNNKIIPEYYDYTLAIPHVLTVTVNGEINEGVKRDDGLMLHKLVFLKKPEVVISDLFGNEIKYEGKSLPLTYTKIIAPESFEVTCEGIKIPDKATVKTPNPEFELITELVDGVPMRCEYTVAVLKSKPQIKVLNAHGSEVDLKANEKVYDLMKPETLDSVPNEVSAAVDVLSVAQNWSLFMSNDFKFSEISQFILPNSNQYKFAKEYSTSVDKTFFSDHTLKDPPFTECGVENFIWITEDCFSVDIKFVKHMRLNTGKSVDDAMNDSFYFVKQDGKWLIAAMKEVNAND